MLLLGYNNGLLKWSNSALIAFLSTLEIYLKLGRIVYLNFYIFSMVLKISALNNKQAPLQLILSML